MATGFRVSCPHCGAIGGAEDDGLVVELGTLTLKCTACSEEVSTADLERMIGDAQRLVRWLGLAATV